MSRKYKFHNLEGAYFISFATVNWVDVFTREIYFNVLAESLTFCRKNKGMKLYAYCIMSNHVHMVFQSLKGDPSGLLRDFKGFTSKKLVSAIINNAKESRKEYLLKIFANAGAANCNVEKYQFWQQNNQPIELWSRDVINQKINYIHMNPVKAGFVTKPTEWKYSSARNYEGDQSVLEIDLIRI